MRNGEEGMAVEWRIKGTEVCNCNCAYGCPCQFNALPTQGNCEGLLGFEIEEGFFGAVRLDGLRAVMLVKYPGAIHEGNGTMQLVIDDRATPEQRNALVKILSGEETEQMATIFWVYSAMAPYKLEPVIRAIDIDVDVEARRAHIRVPGILDVTAEPIHNPVTGAEHRARINLPHGIEFRVAEQASGTTRTMGALALVGLDHSHSHLARLDIGSNGVID
jgi:hypothetical protein